MAGDTPGPAERSGRRPVLLLLPGMLNTGAVFDRLTPHIDPGVTVHVVDGFSQETMAGMAAHAWKQAPAVGAVHLAGFSMGGFVAQEMLVADPARVAGIALINSATGVDSAEQLVIREKTIAAAERDFGRLCERIIDFGLHPDHRTEADLRQAMRGTLEAAGVANCIQHNRAVMTRRDLGPALAQSRAPLLVITSDNDAVVERSRAEAVLGLRPDATLSVIADAGHMTILENPRAVAAALNAWLRG